jgi:hypothetical protein
MNPFIGEREIKSTDPICVDGSNMDNKNKSRPNPLDGSEYLLISK